MWWGIVITLIVTAAFTGIAICAFFAWVRNEIKRNL